MKDKDIEEKEERESESMKKSVKREGGSCSELVMANHEIRGMVKNEISGWAAVLRHL